MNQLLSEEEQQDRASYLKKQKLSQIKTIAIIMVIVFTGIWGTTSIIKNHQNMIAQQKAAQERQAKKDQEAARLAEQSKAEQDFIESYKGRLEAWENILGNDNPIKGWPVRRREYIIQDIANKEAEITNILSKIGSATTRTEHNNGNTSLAYNVEQMSELQSQLKKAEYELYLLNTELRRDEYFEGRIAGYDLK